MKAAERGQDQGDVDQLQEEEDVSQPLSILGEDIDVMEAYKYLGVHLDKRLN